MWDSQVSGPRVWVQNNLMQNLSGRTNIIDLSCIILKKIWTISEVEFALEDESVEFSGVRTIKWIGFPEFGLGTGVVGFENLVNSLGKCISFSIGTSGT